MQNVNPNFLHRCSVDEDCAYMKCKTTGTFANFFQSMTFTVKQCAGLEIDLIEADGKVAFKEIVIAPTVITRAFSAVNAATAIININVYVNMTATSLRVAVSLTSL